MNNTFNFKRFGLAFRKDLIENGKRYLLMFVTLFGLIAVISIYITWNYYDNHSRTPDYLDINKDLLTILSFVFMGAGIWFASTFTNPMNSKLRRISYLVSPASNLEKYLVRWIITTLGFIIAFFVALWIADALKVAICTVKFPDAGIQFFDISKLYGPDNKYNQYYVMPKSVFYLFLSLYFLLQSIFLLGSIIWDKASFIKTFSASTALIIAYIFICRWTILLFYGDLNGYGNVLSSFRIFENMSEVQSISFSSIMMAVFTLVFWVLAFFRLKESEIIKRF